MHLILERLVMSKREKFIERAKEKHAGYYQYDLVEYVNTHTKVKIICPKHGVFEQTPHNHLNGGCYQCRNETIGANKRLNGAEFVKRAKLKHGDFYDYSRVVYERNSTKVEILCPKHGSFLQAPTKHLSGQGCPKCGQEKTVRTHLQGYDTVLQRCREAHGDRYDYTLVKFDKVDEKVEIICPEHGIFKQALYLHYGGQGCPKCAKEVIKSARLSNTESFIASARQLHGESYDYSFVRYYNNKTPVEIVCPKHGSFWQTANDHLDGHGCSACNRQFNGVSKASEDLMNFIRQLAPDLQQEVRMGTNKRFRADGYIPSKRLFVEYNGLIWHSRKFKRNKNDLKTRWEQAKALGCELLVIHEDEWLHKRELVENLIRYKLGMMPNVYARKCELILVEPDEAKRFYQQHHIQGCLFRPQLSYGLKYQGELVACMSFAQKGSNRKTPYQTGLWELIRFASSCSVVGGASRLFQSLLRHTQAQEVVSFSMNHLFSGRVYEILGFKLDKELSADYQYIDTKRILRLHKSNFQHSRLEKRFADYDRSKTEEVNCAVNGFYRIYDCGKKRWIWRRTCKE